MFRPLFSRLKWEFNAHYPSFRRLQSTHAIGPPAASSAFSPHPRGLIVISRMYRCIDIPAPPRKGTDCVQLNRLGESRRDRGGAACLKKKPRRRRSLSNRHGRWTAGVLGTAARRAGPVGGGAAVRAKLG